MLDPAAANALIAKRARLAAQSLDDPTQPRLVPAVGLLVVLTVANALDVVRLETSRRRWHGERAARLVADE